MVFPCWLERGEGRGVTHMGDCGGGEGLLSPYMSRASPCTMLSPGSTSSRASSTSSALDIVVVKNAADKGDLVFLTSSASVLCDKAGSL